MVVNPDELLGRYVEAGCELVIVHAEACTHLHRTLAHIRLLQFVVLTGWAAIDAGRAVSDDARVWRRLEGLLGLGRTQSPSECAGPP